MILRAVYTKDRFGWNLVTEKLKFQKYFASTLFKLFSGTICGCKSCDGIKDEHKTLCNQRQSHCIRRRMGKSTATELALFLVLFSFPFVNGMEMKSFPHDLPSRWQSDGCWKAILRHYHACSHMWNWTATFFVANAIGIVKVPSLAVDDVWVNSAVLKTLRQLSEGPAP